MYTLWTCLNVWALQISRSQAPLASQGEEFVGGLKSEKVELKSQAASDREKLTLWRGWQMCTTKFQYSVVSDATDINTWCYESRSQGVVGGRCQEMTFTESMPEPSLKREVVSLPGKEKCLLTAEQGRSVTPSTWLHRESTHHQSPRNGQEHQLWRSMFLVLLMKSVVELSGGKMKDQRDL